MPQTDVIIIGAGVAGLSAAAALSESGLRYVVLEAADRIGGRAFTDHPTALGGAPFDRGASWLHMAERNPLVEIARRHNEDIRVSTAGSSRRVVIDGRFADASAMAAYARAQDAFSAYGAARADQAPDIAFADAFRALSGDPWTATIAMWEAELIAAADPARFSLADWRLNELDGVNMSVPGGIGDFVARRLAVAEVVLGCPVHRLEWGRGAVAHAAQGVWRGRAAIVTVSTGVLAADGIGFDPLLPAPTRAAIAGLPMGLLTKVALPALGADRLGLSASCSVQRRLRPGEPAMFFQAWPRGADHVVGFVGGPTAWRLARQGPAAAEAFARAQWQLCLGEGADRVLGPAVVTDWGTDPHHLGAYAYAVPGQAGARGELGRPLAGGRLIFAGEAVCTDGLAGTVGGAWLSGREAAREVAACLV